MILFLGYNTFIILSYTSSKVGHMLSYTYISKNVFKCILKHAFEKYYTMKSNNFLLLIIKIKNIHEFNVLKVNLLIFFPQKNQISLVGIVYHIFTLTIDNVTFFFHLFYQYINIIHFIFLLIFFSHEEDSSLIA
jgi:hypothetical protein